MDTDITIRENKENKSFTMFGSTFVPLYIGVANTEKGVEFEHKSGNPDVKIGEEFPRSEKGYRKYTYINHPSFEGLLHVPSGLKIDLCGILIASNK